MDYKNGQIYCIRSHQTDQIYIGSTCSPLAKRFYDHKKKSNNRISKQITQYEDAYIELIENYPCNSKKELNRREGQHMRNTENCINKNIAGRTLKEYESDNKEQIVLYHKNWYNENKEQLLKKQKEYNENHKEQKSLTAKQRYLKKKFEATLIEPSSSAS
jgi:predicted GIY-YIG superfamily endonuclease